MCNHAKWCKQNILPVRRFYQKEWKDGTHSKRVLTALLMQVREIRVLRVPQIPFLPFSGSKANVGCYFLMKGIAKSCFLVVQVWFFMMVDSFQRLPLMRVTKFSIKKKFYTLLIMYKGVNTNSNRPNIQQKLKVLIFL